MRPPLIILAGGKGTRLGNLTKDKPKPMVDVYGRPFLYCLLEHYIDQGFTDITVSTGYKAEVIENYPWPWNIKFKRDEDFLLKDAEHVALYRRKGLPACWLVNGDTFIPEHLPEVGSNWVVVSSGDVDAGAQYRTWNDCFPIKLHKTQVFYDIGTPEGLERFTQYYRQYLVELTLPTGC